MITANEIRGRCSGSSRGRYPPFRYSPLKAAAARLQKLWINQKLDRSFKVDDFAHSNGTSLTSHVLLLLRSGLCDGSMGVTARRHSTLQYALDDADDCTRSPRKHESDGHTHAWHLVEALCVSECILDAR